MIEFKAACGHTVNARDEDAGRIVRCSHCGRNSPVPTHFDQNLNNLLHDLERSGETDDKFNRKQRRQKFIERFKQRWSRIRFDPLAILLKVCYMGVLVAIVYFITQQYLLPRLKNPGGAKQTSNATQEDEDSQSYTDTQQYPSSTYRPPGKIKKPGNGLYVTSIPNGATVYFAEESSFVGNERVAQQKSVRTFTATRVWPRLNDSAYVVEVAFRWNDPALNNPRLQHQESYVELRRQILTASPEQRDELIQEYFIPDESTAFFVEETDDQFYFVKQYRQVVVHGGKSKGVRALFLPRLDEHHDINRSIQALLKTNYLNNNLYVFDEKFVENELSFYGVKLTDRAYVIEALYKLGIIPYVTPNGDTMLFKIGIYEGEFATEIIRNNSES